jgi:4-hydroxy-3-methylbut-2-enyl diphosphate reductase
MIFVSTLDDIPQGSHVLFSAHGVPPKTWTLAKARHLIVTDATCPFVTKVHNEALRYAARNFTILLIGHRKHDEVIGVAGEAPNHIIVVETESEASTVTVPHPDQVVVLTQTTLSPDEVSRVMAVLRQRFPALCQPSSDDICYATRNRQQGVREVAPLVDAFVILGSENSSNSNRLVEVARAAGCPKAFLADTPEKLATIPLDAINTLGITAGASTPEYVVKAAMEQLSARGFTTVEEHTFIREDIHFTLPRSLH